MWRDKNDLHDEKFMEKLLWSFEAEPLSRPATYLATKWSWASLHGKVGFYRPWEQYTKLPLPILVGIFQWTLLEIAHLLESTQLVCT